MDNTTNTTPVTLESIAQKKAMLLQEIRLQKEIMTGLTQEILLRWNQLPTRQMP